MSDIVERLRNTLTGSDGARQTLNEAADEIERLRAEVARLVKSRNKWGQKYNKTLEKLKAAVWSDSEYVKAVDEAANAAIIARDEAVREVSRLGRDLGTTQDRLAEAVEVVREFHDAAQIDAVMEGPRLTGWNRSALNRAWPKATAFLAKLEGRLKELPVSMSDEEILTSLFGAKVERALPTDDEALVEKVAMAIWDERCKHWGKYRKHLHKPNSEGYDWDDLSLSKRKELTREALAAIRAMEEKP